MSLQYPLEAEKIIGWLETEIVPYSPGVILGISGTDSILSFLLCAEAFRRAGRGNRVLGVHYGTPYPLVGKTAEDLIKLQKMIETTSPSLMWVPRILLPWLKERCPEAELTVDNVVPGRSDHSRWADISERALNGAHPKEPLNPEGTYWICGTRNRTEDVLCTYSNLSCAAVLQPLVHLWKSDVLRLCRELGVPGIALEKSRQVDCDCGRFDLAAGHIEEVDLLLQYTEGVPGTDTSSIPEDLQNDLMAFINEQRRYAGFKKRIPYMPLP